jgi:hypothetical protein
MKRTGLMAVLGLSLVALVAPAVSAHGGPGDHQGRGHGPLRAFATDTAQGGTMTIYAAVGGHRLGALHPSFEPRPRCETDVVVGAVVHFVSGDVAVALPAVQHENHASRHFFQGTVLVGGTEATGPVAVDVTATCGDLSAMVTVSANITVGSAPPPPQNN